MTRGEVINTVRKARELLNFGIDLVDECIELVDSSDDDSEEVITDIKDVLGMHILETINHLSSLMHIVLNNEVSRDSDNPRITEWQPPASMNLDRIILEQRLQATTTQRQPRITTIPRVRKSLKGKSKIKEPITKKTTMKRTSKKQ